jgi:hypothetical protein
VAWTLLLAPLSPEEFSNFLASRNIVLSRLHSTFEKAHATTQKSALE